MEGIMISPPRGKQAERNRFEQVQTPTRRHRITTEVSSERIVFYLRRLPHRTRIQNAKGKRPLVARTSRAGDGGAV
jgi:hypothetical protein